MHKNIYLPKCRGCRYQEFVFASRAHSIGFHFTPLCVRCGPSFARFVSIFIFIFFSSFAICVRVCARVQFAVTSINRLNIQFSECHVPLWGTLCRAVSADSSALTFAHIHKWTIERIHAIKPNFARRPR